MRIDKFLKNSRLIKRRTIAKEACDQGRIDINGKSAKAGSEVAVGDRVSIRLGDKIVTVEVLELSEHATKDAAKDMYRMVD